MKKYILALDAGTTSSRAILFDHSGKICSISQREFRQYYPHPGWVEHDANEIWASQLSVAVEAMQLIQASSDEIAGIGIANQRETTIVWNKKTGEPVCHAIVWQCRRTAEYCEELGKRQGFQEWIRSKTGLIPDAYFSATKLKWILDNIPGAQEMAENGELLFGTVDTWLIWKLTGGKIHVTDYSNASRTMMFNIHTLQWDPEILDFFGIPRKMLPDVMPNSCVYGLSSDQFFGRNIPISGSAGDQQAALFGQNCFAPGTVKNTYGTGGFLLMNTGSEPVNSHNGLLTTVAWGIGDEIRYALEGSVFIAGAAIQWLRDEMKLIDSAPESEKIAESVPDTNGCYVVPAFTGLGAPYWDPYARGTITGITRGVNRAHIVRATLESLAYQVNDVIHAMSEDGDMDLQFIRADGGASANNFLLQTQADLSGIPVVRPSCIETTALGAAYLAGLAVGFWNDPGELEDNMAVDRIFHPQISEEERTERLSGWKRAVKASMGWVKEQQR